MKANRWRTRFDDPDGGFDPLTNLVDIMLVFAVGLMAALVAVSGNQGIIPATQSGSEVERKRDLPEMPQGLDQSGAGPGYENVGNVYRDPKTGKLYLIDKK